MRGVSRVVVGRPLGQLVRARCRSGGLDARGGEPQKLSRPLDNDIIERMNSELMSRIGKMPGVADALCVQVADDGIVVVVICESEESLQRVHHEVGTPWIRENLTPYLAGTDRKTGPVIARRENV